MTSAPLHRLQLDVSEDIKRRFEDGAASLHLTPAAYLSFLLERHSPGVDATRLDNMVGEVFGRHGEVMRRLAK